MDSTSATILAKLSRTFYEAPGRLSILGFALLILGGMLLLMLPAAANGPPLGWIDALFSATSASCVTGLTVVDTGTRLTFFGQIVILGLIQTGGLGIMTMSTLLLLVAGIRPRLTEQVLVKDTFTHSSDRSLPNILTSVILFTLVIEGLGAALICWRLQPDYGLPQAVYQAIFHAVSAFCNAGFSLFSDSLMRFRHDWVLNLVFCFLIVSGGIGFLVLDELRRRFPYNRRRWSNLSLHSKIAVSSTAGLLVAGSMIILYMEWHNTLAQLPLPDRLLAALFQSVTARTAGFNTLAIDQLASETLFFLIILMFIGACPGSCGGGIKTTTVTCLGVLGLSRLMGKKRPQIYRRTISEESVSKAVSLVVISTVVVVSGTLLLVMIEGGGVPLAASCNQFLKLFFEIVSAFGTVGLSTGVTSQLTAAGKLIITAMMFIGRLGPLVVAVAISRQHISRYFYAEENVMIG